MAKALKILSILVGTVALIAIFIFLLTVSRTKENAWQHVKQELNQKNANLKNETQRSQNEIVYLNKMNTSLKKYFDVYENNFIELKDTNKNYYQIDSILSTDLPEKLTKELPQIHQIFREMLNEKKLWDQYKQEQYNNILESTIEPNVIESQSLNLEDENNRKFFIELESALKLHKRLIRDIRLFHDEIQFQKRQRQENDEYELYDLKFQLSPFAFEAALIDALQQAMSAFSAGIYQKEAVEVLDRIGEEFTKPIQELYEKILDGGEYPALSKYNYNLYTLFGKKLMEYSDTLTRQSLIELGPSAFGELDFFNRKLSDSLHDLYEIGQDEANVSSRLDLDELEQVLYFRY